VEKDENKPAGPFKFNPVSLGEEKFVQIVKDEWKIFPLQSGVCNVSVCREFKKDQESDLILGQGKILVFGGIVDRRRIQNITFV
jgi:hypothetical protein